jgi:hypothetical protein
LISAYARCGSIDLSLFLFKKSPYKTAEVCDSLVQGSSKLKHPVPLEMWRNVKGVCNPSIKSARAVLKASVPAALAVSFKEMIFTYKKLLPKSLITCNQI